MEKLNNQGQVQEASLFPAFLTGHAFPLLSHFIIEGLPATSLFCPNIEKICTSWSAGTQPGYEEWVMENTTGYCTEVVMTPTTACSDKVEFGGFLMMTILLIIIYFFVGVLVTWAFPKIVKHLKK